MKPRARSLCVLLLGGAGCSGIIAWSLHISRPIVSPTTPLATVAAPAVVQDSYTEQQINSMTEAELRQAIMRHVRRCHVYFPPEVTRQAREEWRADQKREFDLMFNRLKRMRGEQHGPPAPNAALRYR